jgi:uncharacterized protein (TIGR04255 family)
MTRKTLTRIKYKLPPVNELVIGVGFSPLMSFRAEHVGRYWERVHHDFPKAQQAPTIGNLVEAPGEFLPMGRYWFISDDDTTLIQLQRNKFLCNWRRMRDTDRYPSYEGLKEVFYSNLASFRKFIDQIGIEEPSFIDFELTYVNHISTESGWGSPIDTRTIFPEVGLVGAKTRDLAIIDFDHQNVCQMRNELGTLALRIRSAHRRDTQQHLLIAELTARGRCTTQDDAHMRSWYELAHEELLRVFTTVTAADVQRKVWQRYLER